MVFFQTLRNDGFFCHSMVKGWRGTLGISLAVSTVLETFFLIKAEKKAHRDVEIPVSLSYGHLLETPFHNYTRRFRVVL